MRGAVNSAGKECAKHKCFLLTSLPKPAFDFVNEA